jgi:hypothetical protein
MQMLSDRYATQFLKAEVINTEKFEDHHEGWRTLWLAIAGVMAITLTWNAYAEPKRYLVLSCKVVAHEGREVCRSPRSEGSLSAFRRGGDSNHADWEFGFADLVLTVLACKSANRKNKKEARERSRESSKFWKATKLEHPRPRPNRRSTIAANKYQNTSRALP